MAMRSAVMLGTSSSSFSGRSVAARSSAASAAAPRAVVVSVDASGSTRQCKKCDLTGKTRYTSNGDIAGLGGSSWVAFAVNLSADWWQGLSAVGWQRTQHKQQHEVICSQAKGKRGGDGQGVGAAVVSVVGAQTDTRAWAVVG